MNQTQPDNNEPFKLFKQNTSSRWSMRFSIKGQGQQRITLGVENYSEAKLLAWDKWHEAAALAKLGLSVTRKRFEAIAKEFIEEIEFAVERGEKEPYHARQFPPIVRRYFVGFFGNKLLTGIKSEDIEDYWRWRIDYWVTGAGANEPFIRYERTYKGRTISIRRPIKEGFPSNSTLSKEAQLLKQLFVFGQKRGYTIEIPAIGIARSNKRKVTDKLGFTLNEFLHLEKISQERIKELEGDDKSKRLYFDRQKLHCYCMIAGYTGMRPTELKNLNWGDIEERPLVLENGQRYDALIIQARGKAKERELAPQPECLIFLDTLRNIFMLQAKRQPTGKEPVFFNNNGERIVSFKKGLAALLTAAGLREHSDGRLRDSGSFRPFYISQQIRAGVNTQLLIRNSGTSEKMVVNHYNKIRPSEEIAKLTPDWQMHRMKSIRPK